VLSWGKGQVTFQKVESPTSLPQGLTPKWGRPASIVPSRRVILYLTKLQKQICRRKTQGKSNFGMYYVPNVRLSGVILEKRKKLFKKQRIQSNRRPGFHLAAMLAKLVERHKTGFDQIRLIGNDIRFGNVKTMHNP